MQQLKNIDSQKQSKTIDYSSFNQKQSKTIVFLGSIRGILW
jgi:hypothetical protein